MARPINAALFVSAFTPTGLPGEYTFEGANYNNQADRTGNGTYDVQVGFVLYIPSTDANTGMQIPGVIHRYKFTSVTPVDPYLLNGTIVWDEPGAEETEVPTSGIGCLLSETSPQHKMGFLPSDAVYTELTPGTTVESLVIDSWNVVDAIGGTTTNSYKTTVGDNATLDFVITHSLNTLDVQVEVFELDTGVTVYCGVARSSVNTVALSFTEPPNSNGCRVLVTAA